MMTEALVCGETDASDPHLYSVLVAELTDFAVFFIDPAGCIVSWNVGVERLLGFTEAEWVGHPVEMIFTPEDRHEGAPAEEMAVAARVGRSADTRWHIRKNGERCFF